MRGQMRAPPASEGCFQGDGGLVEGEVGRGEGDGEGKDFMSVFRH